MYICAMVDVIHLGYKLIAGASDLLHLIRNTMRADNLAGEQMMHLAI